MTTAVETRQWIPRSEIGHREWVNFAKGAAILMVILFHVWLFLGWLGLGSVPRVKAVLELFPIAAFFLIAGMFSPRQNSWSLAELWRRRLLPYLYLYVLWSVIRFLFAWIVPVVRGDGGVSARDPINLVVLLVWPTSSYWFIYMLALATLIAWSLRRVNIYVHLAGAGVVSALFLSGILNMHNGGWNGLGEKYFFFVAGTFFAKQVYSLASKVQLWHVLSLTAALAAIGVVLMFFRHWSTQLLAFPGTILALALGIALSTYLVRARVLRFVSGLGAQSFQLYILHLFVVTAVTAAIRPISGLEVLQSFSTPFILVVTVVVVVASVYLGRLAVKVPWLFVPPFAQLARRRKKARHAAMAAETKGPR